MLRSIQAILFAGVITLAFSLAPMLPNSSIGSAQAQKGGDPTTNAINLNTSRSNNYRDTTSDGTSPSTKRAKNLNTSRSNNYRNGTSDGTNPSTNNAIKFLQVEQSMIVPR